jgi:beta-lactamase superfamily II metal-dependent hydrolase
MRTHTTLLRLLVVLLLLLTALPTAARAAGTCGTGTWTPGTLEIHHIDVGQADSTLVVSPTGKTLLFDVGATSAGPYVQTVTGCTQLDYVAISHFHDDHVGSVGSGGLWNLVEVQGFTVGQTLLRDYANYVGEKDLTAWAAYLTGSGQAKLHPVTAVEGTSQVDLGGGVVVNILTVDGNGQLKSGNFYGQTNAPSENDYSLGLRISYGAFDEWLSGDLDGEFSGAYHDIELSVAREIGDVDVYRVHHHGSSHSSSDTFVRQLDPEVSIVSVGDTNTYNHPTQDVIDRLLATSAVYLTERGKLPNLGSAIVAGTIVVKTTDGTAYTVNGDSYTATAPARTDADGDGYFAEVDLSDTDPVRTPAPNGGCDPVYQNCPCQVTPGQAVVNEVLPAPSTGNPEWAELYNPTAQTVDLSYCFIDDIAGGSKPIQIPAGTYLASHAVWSTADITSYFNNPGDSVRLLMDDQTTVLDSFAFGATGSNLAWRRVPDGGPWSAAPTAAPTRGALNTPLLTFTARSQAANDGWILESAEKSSLGGTLKATSATLTLGDNAQKQQYRSILSFSTAPLPDTAVITKVALKLRQISVVPAGTNPITLFQGLLVDLRKGYFGPTAALQVGDFQAPGQKTIGPLKPVLTQGGYTLNLTAAKAYINPLPSAGGLTQFRLRFKLDDNNDALATTLNLASANHANTTYRPTLIVEYYVP